MAIRISNQGLQFEDYWMTFQAPNTFSPLTDIGKCVALDTTAPNTVKFVSSGDRIFGKIEIVENRTIEGYTLVTVSTKFCDALIPAPGVQFVVGDTAVGYGALTGQVQPLKNTATPPVSTPDRNQNVVIEILADGITPVVFLI